MLRSPPEGRGRVPRSFELDGFAWDGRLVSTSPQSESSQGVLPRRGRGFSDRIVWDAEPGINSRSIGGTWHRTINLEWLDTVTSKAESEST